jgi:hypothetical protein
MIANNIVEKTGIIIPEESFKEPESFFKELEKRDILVDEKIDLLHVPTSV